MRKARQVLLLVPAAAVLAVGFTPAVAGLPAHPTLVKVTATKTTRVNAAIGAATSISGKIKSGSTPLAAITVYALGAHGAYVTSAQTGHDGTYHLTGLEPSTSGYAICARSGDSGSGFGYVSRCYKSATWNGTTVPSGAAKVTVSLGHPRTGVNLTMSKAGAITGTVKAAKGKGVIKGVYAQVYSPAGAFLASAAVSNGRYRVTALVPSSKGYRVCFSTALAFGGPSKTGYLGQCYRNTPWTGAKPPAKAELVKVKAGAATGHINAALGVGGAITGSVRSTGHKPIEFASIEVFTKAGALVTFGNSTKANGTYKVVGLRPYASYRVCAGGGQIKGVDGTFDGRCYKNVAWSLSKPPKKATSVSVKTGKTHTGVNLVLPRAAAAKVGAISGRVTGLAGTALNSVYVTAFTGSGVATGFASTASNGTYTITGLPVSSAGYVVCFSGTSAFGASNSPADGYQSACYNQRVWDGGKLPAHTTKVSVRSGKTHAGINASLSAGAAIGGTVTSAADHSALAGVTVFVYASNKQFVSAGFTDSSGDYLVTGLTPSPTGYIVCFDASEAKPAPPTGFLSQCYKNQPWDGNGGPGA